MDAEGRQYPFKGCELRSREVIRRLGQVPANWRLPTFATGFMRCALAQRHKIQRQLAAGNTIVESALDTYRRHGC